MSRNPHPNGRLPDSALAAVPNGRLARHRNAAAAWNAMREAGGRELGIWIRPLGPRSSFRTLAQQQQMWASPNYQAARPGTSNHGWGDAVDLADRSMRTVIDRIGSRFGWRQQGSSQWWHVEYTGGFSGGGGGGGAKPKPKAKANRRPTLRRGARGEAVRRAQRLLNNFGRRVNVDGVYGPRTADAVGRQYRAFGHAAQHHLGINGWRSLEGDHPWSVMRNDERAWAAELQARRRSARRNGGWGNIDPSHLRVARQRKARLVERRQNIWRNGQNETGGWSRHNRRARHRLLQGLTR